MEQAIDKEIGEIGRTAESSLDRERGDIGPTPQNDRLGVRLRKHLAAEVSKEHTDILMLTCCFISGLLDSVVYSAYGTFVSMQTGNTIFVGLGASGQNANKPFGWAKSLTSIFCFILGSFFFSRYCRLLGPLRRSTLFSSFLIQAVFIIVSAALVEVGTIDGEVNVAFRTIMWLEEIPIAMLSFQSAGQMVTSRNLGLNEIPTVVLTSVLCDFASDPGLGKKDNVRRNRRALAFVLILVGAIVGGWIAKALGGMESVMWIAGGIKLLITIAWVLWPQMPQLAIPI
ncbi:MAG: hypothetical protein Q9187_004363 [Circinaria calcarea]